MNDVSFMTNEIEHLTNSLSGSNIVDTTADGMLIICLFIYLLIPNFICMH